MLQVGIFVSVIFCLFGIGVCQWLLLLIYWELEDQKRLKAQTLGLLSAVKEWVDQGVGMRQDVRDDAGRVARKAEQLADAVERVPDRTAEKVVERIGHNSAGDSGKLPTVQMPE